MCVKLLGLLILALCALPQAAIAVNSPEVTYPTGTKLATESAVRAVNVGDTKLTSTGGTLTCSSAALEGILKKNSGTEVEVDIESATFAAGGECTSTDGATVSAAPSKNGVPWCLRSTPEFVADEFQIRGGRCSDAVRPIRFIANTTTTTPGECVYERSGAIVGSYKTSPEDALLTSNGVTYSRVSGSFSCPESISLDTSITLEKDEGAGGALFLTKGPSLQFEGLPLAVNSKLKGHNVGEVLITAGGTTSTCATAELTGTLKKNSEAAVEADIESAAFAGKEGGTCTFPFTPGVTWTFKPATNGLPWCLRATSAMAADEFQIRGNNCASAARPIRILNEWTLTTTTECVYERAAALTGTFTTHPEDAVLKLANAVFLEVEPRKPACPDETTLDSSMTLERAEAGTHPVYIS